MLNEKVNIETEPIKDIELSMSVDVEGQDKQGQWHKFRRAALRHPGLLRIVILLIVVLLGAFERTRFLSESSLVSVLLASSAIALLATGESFVMIRGKFVDLSVGATASAGAVVAALLADRGLLITVVGVVGVGVVIGLVNGTAIAMFQGNSIIVTLGLASVIGAVSLGGTGGKSLTIPQGTLSRLGATSLGGIPVPIIFTFLLIVITSIYFSHSRWGRSLALSGDNELAVRNSGQRIVSSTFVAFILCGVFSALGGLVLASYVGTLDFSIGASLALPAIGGAVIGGVSLFGGQGLPWQAGIGALILGFIESLLLVFGFSTYQEEIIEGLLIIGIVFATERLLKNS